MTSLRLRGAAFSRFLRFKRQVEGARGPCLSQGNIDLFQRNYVLKHLEDLCTEKNKKQNQNNTHDSAADEAAVTEVADDAEAASSAVLFPLALETVDQSCHCVPGEEDRTEGRHESLGISVKSSLLFHPLVECVLRVENTSF